MNSTPSNTANKFIPETFNLNERGREGGREGEREGGKEGGLEI
jgi:hypothetical protein